MTNAFEDMKYITLTGKQNSTIHCYYNAGLAFRNVSNIVLQNVTFNNCGMKFNSTSVNPDYPNTTLVSKAALLFEYCDNLSLNFVTVESSSGVGIQIYNTIGDVNISHCNFVRNKILSNETGNFSGGGGIYIEFSLCQPGTNSIGCKTTETKFTTKAAYTIEHSYFTQNNGSTSDPKRTAFIRAGNHTHFAFGRGGGLSIYLKGNASCNNFKISNCTFTENSALFGAGLFIELQDTSNNNHFGIRGSHFKLNKVISERLGYTGTSGGGAMLGYIIFNKDSGVLYNTAAFTDTVFESNSAFTGGGFSFHSSRENGAVTPTNHLHFTRCYWYNNTARLGGAIDLSILHSAENGQLIKPVFGYCTFKENVVSGFSIDHKFDNYGLSDPNSNNSFGGYWPGTGIMYLDGITVDLSHNVTFFNNTGSAIAAIGAGINLYSSTVLNFINNQGSQGGALYLTGYSWISASPNVQVFFINNSATSLGGAIYAQKTGEHDLVSNSNCFIRYTDNIAPPDKWENVNFRFIDNCASVDNGGDAIYTTTVVDCAWDGSFKAVDNSTLKNVFLKWPNFKFNVTTSNCHRFLQTSARSFKNLPNVDHLRETIAPGEVFPFPFEAQNDFGDTTPTIFAIFSDNKHIKIPNPVVQSNGSSLFTTNGTNSDFYLQFVTVDSRKHVGYVNVSVQDCPLGFYLKNGKCVCISDQYEYVGVSFCNTSALEIQMLPSYWAGNVHNKFFSTYVCPVSYCRYSSTNIILLKNDTSLCRNRVGTLCGTCSPEHGLEIGTYDCVKCSGSQYTAWIIYVITTYTPLTTVFILLLVLNMNLAVGPIHSFILFCQIFPTIAMNSDYWSSDINAVAVINDIYSTIINIMSLKFDLQFSTKLCLSLKMNNMDHYILQYFTALYPLLIMVILLSIIRYCPGCIPIKYFWHTIKRCVMTIRKRTSMQQTVIHGFITFLLLTYANFVNVSFQILTYAVLEDNHGHYSSVKVPFRQGNMEYFCKEHLTYGLIALAFLLIFGILPPLLLIAYPVILSIIGYFRWDDTTTVHTLRKWIPLYKLMPVFDAYWSEFKPNCRMFAGFYFVYRFLAFTIFSLSPYVYQVYFGMSILFVTILVLHSLIQPYKKRTYNNADILTFSIIIAINSFNWYAHSLRAQRKGIVTIQAFRTIIPWIPFVLIISYIVYKIRKAHKRGYTMILDPHIDDETIEEMAYEALLNRIDDDGGDQDDNDD